MAYHESFWVAVTAAAPVIGLAHAIAAGTSMREIGLRAIRQWSALQPLEHQRTMIRDRVEALESRMREFRSKRGPTDEDEVESIEREASGISAELAEMGHDLDEVSLAVKDLRRSLRWAVIRDLTALLSWGATAFALVFSLNSLAAGRDTVSIGVSESLVTVPMSLLIVQGVSTLFELPNLKSFQNVSTRSSDSTNGRVDDS